jgi:hypothetical protein
VIQDLTFPPGTMLEVILAGEDRYLRPTQPNEKPCAVVGAEGATLTHPQDEAYCDRPRGHSGRHAGHIRPWGIQFYTWPRRKGERSWWDGDKR